MSCEECDKKGAAFRSVTMRLEDAAAAHGFELWFKNTPPRVVVLAVPAGPSHGKPEALFETFKEMGHPGLPQHPGHRAKRLRQDHSVSQAARAPAGQTSFLIDSVPPIELVFIDKLLQEGP
jgi:hypothetical protein